MSIAFKINQANRLVKKGQLEGAKIIFSEILTNFPNNQKAKLGLEKIEKATVSSPKKLSNSDDVSKTLPLLVQRELYRLKDLGRYEQLEKYLEDIKWAFEESFDVLFLLGVCARRLGKLKDSMALLQKALRLKPESPDVNLEVANLFVDMKMELLAFKTFDYCRALDPSSLDVLLDYAMAKKENGDAEGALKLLFQADKTCFEDFRVCDQIAKCYFEIGDICEAHKYFSRSLNLVPPENVQHYVIHSNLCNTSSELRLVDELKIHVEKTEQFLEIYGESHHVEAIHSARLNLSLAYFKLGRCTDAWKLYRDRFDDPAFPSPHRLFERPKLNCLQQADGNTLLIWREQGVGDELIFYNLIPILQSKTSAKIIVECDKRLVSSLRKSFPDCDFRAETFDTVSFKCPEEDFDFHMPLADLGYFLEADIGIAARLKPWFHIDQVRASQWRKKIGSDQLTIGFCSTSSVNGGRRDITYLDLEFFEGLIKASDHKWVFLDYALDEDELNRFSDQSRKKIFVPPCDRKNDFQTMAEIISTCDLVIGPCIAPMSLANSVGVPTYTFYPGWGPLFALGVEPDANGEITDPLQPRFSGIIIPPSDSKALRYEKISKYFFDKIISYQEKL